MQLGIYVEPKYLSWLVECVTKSFEEYHAEVPTLAQVDTDKMISLELKVQHKVPVHILSAVRAKIEKDGWRYGAATLAPQHDGTEPKKFRFLRRPPTLNIYGSEAEILRLAIIVDAAYEEHNTQHPGLDILQRPDGKYYVDVRANWIPADIFQSIWKGFKTK